MNLSFSITEGKRVIATGKTEPGTHHFVRTHVAPVVMTQRSVLREPSVVIVAHGNVTRTGDAENVGHTYLRSGASLEVPAHLVPELIDALTIALAEASADPAQVELGVAS